MSEKLSYEELSERLSKANKSIDKYQVLLDDNSKRLEELQKKAFNEYSVNSIEELRELLKEKQKQETEELQNAKVKIEQAEEVLRTIEQELSAIETN